MISSYICIISIHIRDGSFRSPKYPDLYYVTFTDHMHVSNVTCNNKISPILTYHPFNFKVRDVIRKNFYILKNDLDRNIFFQYPLISFRHSKNIREYTIASSYHIEDSLSQNGTFPCRVLQCNTCEFIDSASAISAPKSQHHVKHHFTCIYNCMS
jgi:hypothetical protein